MENHNKQNTATYREDAMTEPVCIICGESLGGYGSRYLGKAVCRSCLSYIRANF